MRRRRRVISALKAYLKRHWPALRLREILLAVLLFAAMIPAIEAIWLRGYENTLVRQTEAELVAQSVALTAFAAAAWPGAAPPRSGIGPRDPGYYHPEPAIIDLNTAPVLSERPAPALAPGPPDPDAQTAIARIEPVLVETGRTTLASFAVLDRRGVVVRGPGLGGDLSALPEVRGALAGRSQTVLRRNGMYHPRYSLEWLSRASALRLHYSRPIVVNGKVVGVLLASRSPRALFRGLYEDLGKLAFGGAVTVGLLVGLAGLVSRGVTRPIETLSEATRAVAAGRGEIPDTPPTAAIEIRALYEDFRSMADAIARRSRYLRDFAAALSHEFKTPLAGIAGAVEILQDHHDGMSEGERRGFLANIAADAQRLSHLVARLLDLARADVTRPDIDACVDVLAPLRRIADARSSGDFHVAIDAPEVLKTVAVPEAVVEAVLTTLVENSFQAKAKRVAITARARGNSVVLTIVDDGPGVAMADRSRLFEPFFTTRRSVGGTGLGLAIARALIEANGGEIGLLAQMRGAAFELSLPMSSPDVPER